MTKNDLVSAIARATGLRQADVKQVVRMTLDEMVEALLDERPCHLGHPVTTVLCPI